MYLVRAWQLSFEISQEALWLYAVVRDSCWGFKVQPNYHLTIRMKNGPRRGRESANTDPPETMVPVSHYYYL